MSTLTAKKKKVFDNVLEAIGDTSFGGFAISLSPGNHVASRFAELSMLTGDGKVRT